MSDQTMLIVIVAGAVAIAMAAFALWRTRKRRQPEEWLDPEFERAVEIAKHHRAEERAEQGELVDLAGRNDQLQGGREIRSLAAEVREDYALSWAVVRERYIVDPRTAIAEAGQLATAVLTERGYPMDDEDYDRRRTELTVDQVRTLHRYRQAMATEGMGSAMVIYQQLFDELLAWPGSADRDWEIPAQPWTYQTSRVRDG